MNIRTALCASMLALSTCVVAMPTALAQEAIQTQYSTDLVEVDLIRAKVQGKVLSVVFAFRNTNPNKAMNYSIPIAEINYVDNTESKKYHVLKDNEGKWLAEPQKASIADETEVSTPLFILPEERKVVWYKFPAPPEGINSITINLPKVSPFDAVELTR